MSRGVRFMAAAVMCAGVLTAFGATSANGASTHGSTINIGTLVPLTGTGINDPTWLAGMQGAVKGINARGGIQGHPVALIECDDQNNPNQAMACAQEMVSDGVIAVAGGISEYGSDIAPILNQAGIAQVGMQPLSSAEFTLPNEFPLASGTLGSFSADAFFGAARGYKKIGVVSFDVASSATAVGFFDTAAAKAHVTVSKVVLIPPTATDYTPYIAAMDGSGAQAVLISLPEAQAVQYIASAASVASKVKPAYFATSLTYSDYLTLGLKNPLVNNVIMSGLVPPVSAIKQFPALKQYIKDMAAEYKSGNPNAAPTNQNAGTEINWLAGTAVAKIANMMSSVPTAATFLQEMGSVQSVQLGLIPPWTPSTPGPSTYPRVSNPYEYNVTVRNGVVVLLSKKPLNIFTALGLTG
jgi:ABC-type branched-subunit amino acid transport system substrate-binding protein